MYPLYTTLGPSILTISYLSLVLPSSSSPPPLLSQPAPPSFHLLRLMVLREHNSSGRLPLSLMENDKVCLVE